ncbi:DUF5000 domain-containing lipoprotein [Compostibacter hankyongensis]|uniref:DUF4959 domain-containing protein n=1 Tax=Compostibacter hankyongensis TaxID=1007089 RepID=A0ABP8FVI8_9BACT
MYKRFFPVIFVLLSLAACKEDKTSPIENDGKAPGPVSDVQVENLPGAARLTYKAPGDEDMLYVEAHYDIREGQERIARSSLYKNYMMLEGFGDSSTHNVTLYAVDRGLNKSTPVEITVHPKTPPVYDVFKSLSMAASFGGMGLSMKNSTEANIAIVVITPDSLGEMSPAETFYTSRIAGDFYVRGYDTVKRTFGIYVRDRWNNLSDTLFEELTPLFEAKLDKTKFRKVDLPTDYNKANQNGAQVMEHLWDDSRSENDFTTLPGFGLPQWFTFDLGIKSKLSRMVVWTRTSSRFLYQSGAVKKWEIYGSNSPAPDGSWDSWTLLMRCESIKPSGLPVGTNSQEDLDFVNAGWEFTFPPDAPPVRYIRWKTLENWGNVTHITLTEMDLFGAPEQ